MRSGRTVPAHAAGIVHRDIKPANVLVNGSRVVLTDFGAAAIQSDPALTGSGMFIGTPEYTAPERAQQVRASPISDLWSLGATLYAAVEGRPPYTGPDSLAVLSALLTSEPPPPRRAGPPAPVVTGLMCRDMGQRLTAEQARDMLARVAGSVPEPPSVMRTPTVPVGRVHVIADTAVTPGSPLAVPPEEPSTVTAAKLVPPLGTQASRPAVSQGTTRTGSRSANTYPGEGSAGQEVYEVLNHALPRILGKFVAAHVPDSARVEALVIGQALSTQDLARAYTEIRRRLGAADTPAQKIDRQRGVRKSYDFGGDPYVTRVYLLDETKVPSGTRGLGRMSNWIALVERRRPVSWNPPNQLVWVELVVVPDGVYETKSSILGSERLRPTQRFKSWLESPDHRLYGNRPESSKDSLDDLPVRNFNLGVDYAKLVGYSLGPIGEAVAQERKKSARQRHQVASQSSAADQVPQAQDTIVSASEQSTTTSRPNSDRQPQASEQANERQLRILGQIDNSLNIQRARGLRPDQWIRMLDAFAQQAADVGLIERANDEQGGLTEGSSNSQPYPMWRALVTQAQGFAESLNNVAARQRREYLVERFEEIMQNYSNNSSQRLAELRKLADEVPGSLTFATQSDSEWREFGEPLTRALRTAERESMARE